MAGHELLSFMDAFSGYNQIQMHPDDYEKTTFITDRGLYYYKAYVDDMLVKSKKAEQHLADLKEVFGTLRKYQMKLNLMKCVFGVGSDKFLRFMVHVNVYGPMLVILQGTKRIPEFATFAHNAEPKRFTPALLVGWKRGGQLSLGKGGTRKVLITDNGSQFINWKFKAFCVELKIDHQTTTIHQPQINGQTEVINRILLHGLKTRLDKANDI
ncbi:PREDICTED: uncharacterized protein LOC104606080 [Nelumbo nucifera]|uniref:Uncharacterized protein LOC104606080 n=1 Tax=Nelumbo nucifera TaxID=4432 RepID=A0A1U8B1J1_NELNU|nr:PREDICTED: uncharacterized protein LOC104606080 [Nelumbo nucifera]